MPGSHSGEEIEKEACFIIGLLAIKQEHQHLIAERKALPALVALLKRYLPTRCVYTAPTAKSRGRGTDEIIQTLLQQALLQQQDRFEIVQGACGSTLMLLSSEPDASAGLPLPHACPVLLTRPYGARH